MAHRNERFGQLDTAAGKTHLPPAPVKPYDAFHPANAFGDRYRGRRVFVTGHTGFKGAWLCEWLCALGAEVTGFSRSVPTDPALFDQLGLTERLADVRGDVRDLPEMSEALSRSDPDYVFHLAAQSLVRASYRDPLETWQTNVLGTAHVLEALRRRAKPCAAVVVTTDKCYENQDHEAGYREDDPLGGHDPYSASKASAELAAASWRRSFLAGSPVAVATARAGNVIGGGDWAEDRILPDSVRALMRQAAIPVRNPDATRPWQHVLEPLSAYLALGAALCGRTGDDPLCTSFNFGPDAESHRPVRDLVDAVLAAWPGRWEIASDAQGPHEARLLHLDTTRARTLLGWRPRWGFDEGVARTVRWYRDLHGCNSDPAAARKRTREDIDAYAAG